MHARVCVGVCAARVHVSVKHVYMCLWMCFCACIHMYVRTLMLFIVAIPRAGGTENSFPTAHNVVIY